MDERYDVVVIGGGAAGLSGAVALARFRRSVLVVDSGSPRSATAAHVHNVLTRDGAPPEQIYATGREEVLRFGGAIEDGEVQDVRLEGDAFEVRLAGRSVRARRVLLATGVRDELPDIPGLAQRWGIDALHCPFCHGYEVRDRAIGILSTGPMAVHRAQLFRQLTTRITFLTHTGPGLAPEDREKLAALGVEIVDGEVVEVESGAGGLDGVRLRDGQRVELDALVVAPRFRARAEMVASLGIEPVPSLMGEYVLGDTVATDPMGATSVPGVWAAGNLTDMRAQVVSSAASGLAVAAAILMDLVDKDAELAVHSYRHARVHGEKGWDQRYREREHTWSGAANQVLATEVADLAPGTALDAGAGEGGDACWLAERGWTVTGTDISSVALGRAAATAQDRGLHVEWLHLDLAAEAAPRTYDLVTSHYLHMPRVDRERAFAHLAAAVAPGGTLLVVGHDPSDMAKVARPGLAEMGWTPQEVVDVLGTGWRVEVAESRPRQVHDERGREVNVADAVLRARRQA